MKICRNCNTKVADDALVCPSCGCVMKKRSNSENATPDNSHTKTSSSGTKKKNTWLWILGWLFIFPVPLTIIMLKNQTINKNVRIGIIVAAWLFYLVIVYGAANNSSKSNNGKKSVGTPVEVTSNIEHIKINTDAVTVKIGEKTRNLSADVDVKNRDEFKPSDVVFVSDDPSVATISFIKEALKTYLYYEITGVGAGETYVYAKSTDGTVVSEKIHVIVPAPVLIETLSFGEYESVLVAGEKKVLNVSFLPYDAENANLKWSSSDTSVISVDDYGKITAVGGGTATVTAASDNGITATADFTVDGSKTLMKLNTGHSREDNVNIGDDWSFDIYVNDDFPSNTMGVAVGDKLKFSAKITESDENPDVGSASTSYTVTEKDIANGFEVCMDVYVKENAGKNRGKSAHFVVTYTFSPNK